MKNWTKRSIAILALGAAGTLALCMRPALSADAVEPAFNQDNKAVPLDPRAEAEASLDVEYPLALNMPLGLTGYIYEKGSDAFQMIEPAIWKIRIHTKDGKLHIDGDAPVLHATDSTSLVQTSYRTLVFRGGSEKRPDNSYHSTYTALVLCSVTITPSFWGAESRTTLIQCFTVDPVDGTVDPKQPFLPLANASRWGDPVTVSRFPVQGLPTRSGSGSRAEKALTDMLYSLGAIDNRIAARNVADILTEHAGQALRGVTDPDKPWPECWGEAAGMARLYARRITPTLCYLQEHNCFNCQELADFINSPVFARYFGESFADKAPDPLDAPIGDFIIEKVSPEEMDRDDATPQQ